MNQNLIREMNEADAVGGEAKDALAFATLGADSLLIYVPSASCGRENRINASSIHRAGCEEGSAFRAAFTGASGGTTSNRVDNNNNKLNIVSSNYSR